MADSLRDQLIAAGYEAPKKEEKRKTSQGANSKGGKNRKAKGSPSSRQAQQKNGQSGKQNNNRNNRNAHKSQSAGTPTGNNQSSSPNTSRNTGKRSRKGAAHQNEDPKVIEERKKLKAQIKTLIDDNKTENWKGEVAYRYLVEKRIRELYVTEEIQKKLADRELAVTRLNGDTYLVPKDIALSIKGINPQWSVFNLETDAPAAGQSDDSGSEYAEFQVPDDLKW